MNVLFKTLTLACCAFALCTGTAQTYYIDYSAGSDARTGISKESAWKRCPGMKGFAGSYRHQAGDRFVFKGGCVWPAAVLPLAVAHSGSEGSVDSFTTDHTWFNGVSWTQPVFSGQHSRTQLLVATDKSHFVINDLKFIDYGRGGVENGGKAMDLCSCSQYVISHCTVAPQAWIGLYIHSFSGAKDEDILIEHNDISAAGQAIVIAVEAPGTRMDRVTIRDNAIHDLSTQIVGETHGDGIHTWNSVQSDRSQYISNLTIRDNRFYGDFSCGDGGSASMTALIYLTDPGKRAVISGNELSYTATTRFASLIWVRYFDSVAVVNNTLVLDTAQGGIGIIVGQGDAGKRVLLKNNIIAGAKYCYYIYGDATPTTIIDNNSCTTTGHTVAYWNLEGKTWPQWQALGNDTKGIRGDPLFRSNADLRLSPLSPCIGRADTAMGGWLTGDGIRPTKRDMGAHELANIK